MRFKTPNKNFSNTGLLGNLGTDFIADDLTKVFFENENASYQYFCVVAPFVEYLGTNLVDVPTNRVQHFWLQKCLALKTVGDLSDWDLTNSTIQTLSFSACLSLGYIGDIGKWDISNLTHLGNLLKGCFNLQGVTDKIGDWDTSNITALSWLFESCNYIGDETLHTLGKWDVGNCTNFRGVFCYLYENGFKDGGEYYLFYKRNRMPYPPQIVNKRTNLSFVEDWNVSKGTKFEGFFANNPYLVNVGDLRKWDLSALEADPTLAANQGFTAFIQGCSALENLKMPSIPRGVDVNYFAEGCTSLANIEVNALNVEAISFEDSPLTKQSVLNLINAATGDVEITLKPSVYTAYAADSDVVAALAAKAGSNINVSLATTE